MDIQYIFFGIIGVILLINAGKIRGKLEGMRLYRNAIRSQAQWCQTLLADFRKERASLPMSERLELLRKGEGLLYKVSSTIGKEGSHPSYILLCIAIIVDVAVELTGALIMLMLAADLLGVAVLDRELLRYAFGGQILLSLSFPVLVGGILKRCERILDAQDILLTIAECIKHGDVPDRAKTALLELETKDVTDVVGRRVS